QAEDGIRAFHVTGVQTCALPIYSVLPFDPDALADTAKIYGNVKTSNTRAEGEVITMLGCAPCQIVPTTVVENVRIVRLPDVVGRAVLKIDCPASRRKRWQRQVDLPQCSRTRTRVG